MKVLFVAPANSIHTVKWVNALSQNGNNVCLVSQKNHMADINAISSRVKVKYLHMSGTCGYYCNVFEIKRIVKEFHPDVINAHYASGYGTLCRVAHLSHVILSVWGSDVYDFPYQSKIKMYILKKNLIAAEKITSTSYAMANQVYSLVNLKRNSITIIPFGVDINIFKKTNAIVGQVFTVGTVKSLEPIYGMDVIIRAFNIFTKAAGRNKGEIKLVIYGAGTSLHDLQNLSEELGISKEVCFKGRIRNIEVPKAYNTMDVVCFGSHCESFGVSVIEAMACERPVIATDTDGFKEVVENNKSGYIIADGDINAMANKLIELYRDPELCKKIGREARQRVTEKYNWDDNVTKMIHVYNEMKEKN